MGQVAEQSLLRVENLSKTFPIKSPIGRTVNALHAVNNVSLSFRRGETFGLVGETGCGKSTFGRTILKLLQPCGGKIIYRDQDITNLSEREMRPYRQQLQMVFQDPYTSLNPRKRVGSTLEEVLKINRSGTKAEREDRIMEIFEKVGLLPQHYYRFPHEFSGGQLQRISLACALIQNPNLVVCDEPVSALDVSVQSQIINLLLDLQQQDNVAYLFIAHDMSVVRHVSTGVGVMYLGILMEEGETDEMFAHPAHPYTQALLSSVPLPDPHSQRKRIVLEGDIPSPVNLPDGCVFHTRCRHCKAICKEELPRMKEVSPGHRARCHQYG
jgi:peptide/nickel transport system ATP-binding protein/oligopeptide transport system ATP-binding protein